LSPWYLGKVRYQGDVKLISFLCLYFLTSFWCLKVKVKRHQIDEYNLSVSITLSGRAIGTFSRFQSIRDFLQEFKNKLNLWAFSHANVYLDKKNLLVDIWQVVLAIIVCTLDNFRLRQQGARSGSVALYADQTEVFKWYLVAMYSISFWP
jgi:hypothetical protein